MPSLGYGSRPSAAAATANKTRRPTSAPVPSVGEINHPAAPGGALATPRPQEAAPVSPRSNSGEQYMQAFQQSLDAQRAGIDTQLMQAIGRLQESGNRSAAVLATLPKALQQSYSGAAGQLQGANESALLALSPDVNQQVVTQSAAPLAAALKANQGASASTSPLLEQARLAQVDAGQNNLQTAAIGARADLDSQGRELALQRMMMEREDQQRAQDRMWSKQDRQWEMRNQNRATAEGYAHENDVLAQRYQQEQDAANSARRDEMLAPVGLTANEYDDIVDTPAYRYALKSMSTGLSSGRDPMFGGDIVKLTPAAIVEKYRGKNDKLLAALAADNVEIANLLFGVAPQ